jgi:hypothetical protein
LLREAYPEGDFVQWLTAEFTDAEVGEILSATSELRKDPKERDSEEFRSQVEEWKNKNPDTYNELLAFD